MAQPKQETGMVLRCPANPARHSGGAMPKGPRHPGMV